MDDEKHLLKMHFKRIEIQELIGSIQNDDMIDSRKLYDVLDVKSRHNDWIRNRLESYKFLKDGIDYYSFTKNLVKGGRQIDYKLTIDSAKHIALMENTEIGYEIRQAFIDFEKNAIEYIKKSNARHKQRSIELGKALLTNKRKQKAISRFSDEDTETLLNIIDKYF